MKSLWLEGENFDVSPNFYVRESDTRTIGRMHTDKYEDVTSHISMSNLRTNKH